MARRWGWFRGLRTEFQMRYGCVFPPGLHTTTTTAWLAADNRRMDVTVCLQAPTLPPAVGIDPRSLRQLRIPSGAPHEHKHNHNHNHNNGMDGSRQPRHGMDLHVFPQLRLVSYRPSLGQVRASAYPDRHGEQQLQVGLANYGTFSSLGRTASYAVRTGHWILDTGQQTAGPSRC